MEVFTFLYKQICEINKVKIQKGHLYDLVQKATYSYSIFTFWANKILKVYTKKEIKF